MLSLAELKSLHKLFNKRELVLLLSHMRAYTSLTGHIFGSNPEIEGYYEMHKGYFSWKSLYHAKLLYYTSHPVKPSAKHLFDKVLHSEHYVAPELLNRKDINAVFSIRQPEDTILSIVSHYQKVDAKHDYCSPEYAANYYIERVNSLAELSGKITTDFIYFDAEAIKDDTQALLKFLSEKLALETPLSPQYQKMKQTGSRFSGDSSAELFSGRIQQQSKVREHSIEISKDLLVPAKDAYLNAREVIIGNAKNNVFTVG
ncbi:MAG: hypothetical protein CL811_00620 [Colwelliaceae bacterium]|nr:hypothetical protein [Colwelliaceae bacterium]|tara:strand:- start:370 stop:1143 length:774 start_codon:yes stop_codon:yes gene_type:complete